MTTCVWN